MIFLQGCWRRRQKICPAEILKILVEILKIEVRSETGKSGIWSLECMIQISAKSNKRVQITKGDKIGCVVDKKTFKPLKTLLNQDFGGRKSSWEFIFTSAPWLELYFSQPPSQRALREKNFSPCLPSSEVLFQNIPFLRVERGIPHPWNLSTNPHLVMRRIFLQPCEKLTPQSPSTTGPDQTHSCTTQVWNQV